MPNDYEATAKPTSSCTGPARVTITSCCRARTLRTYASYQWGVSSDTPLPQPYALGSGISDQAARRTQRIGWYTAQPGRQREHAGTVRGRHYESPVVSLSQSVLLVRRRQRDRCERRRMTLFRTLSRRVGAVPFSKPSTNLTQPVSDTARDRTCASDPQGPLSSKVSTCKVRQEFVNVTCIARFYGRVRRHDHRHAQ